MTAACLGGQSGHRLHPQTIPCALDREIRPASPGPTLSVDLMAPFEGGWPKRDLHPPRRRPQGPSGSPRESLLFRQSAQSLRRHQRCVAPRACVRILTGYPAAVLRLPRNVLRGKRRRRPVAARNHSKQRGFCDAGFVLSANKSGRCERLVSLRLGERPRFREEVVTGGA